ncbi:MAG: cellulose binding domain-containing protein [Mucilaginibacter sp.]
MKERFTYYYRGLYKHSIRWLLLCVVVLITMMNVSAQTFIHPGIPFTRQDLDQLKANITKQPWLAGYTALQNDAHSQLSYAPKGPFATVTRAPNLNNAAWIDDMQAIHNLTFMYVFTGDSAYARKATNLLDAWAATNTSWGGNENMLDIGDMAPYFVVGADILKSTFPGWSSANDQHVNNYFRNVLFPTSYVPNPLRDNNKGALQCQIAIGIAAYLNDPVLWQQAIEVYRMDAGAALRCSLPNGEVGDSGRDDHWFVQIQALGWSAEVAWKQGIDLFSEFNNRLLAIGELYAQYSQAPGTVSFIPFGGYSNYWTNWGIPPGYVHQSPFNNIIKGAYELRKGLSAPYTEQIRALAGEGQWSFLYLKSADTSHAAPLPPIVYPADQAQPAIALTNLDIGNTGINGNAAYSNGTWTANGAGNSVATAVNYTFEPVTGNAGMIVKIDSNSVSSAISGLMIRQSLATTANYAEVNLSATGNVSSSSRGSTGTSDYTHYGPKAPWWLKIERVGNRIFTYHSKDGVNWSCNAQFILTLPANFYIGFYTISNNSSTLNRAVFTNVAINNTSPAGSPVITSATSASATVGTSFSYATTASGSPALFRATGLPAGLAIDSLSGNISGSPTAIGQSIVTLQAINSNGTGASTLVINTTANIAPVAPAGVAATVVNGFNINLAWQAVPNASTYTVKRSLNAAGPFTVLQSGITGTSFIDASPTPEVSNYYIITASAGTLEGPASTVVSASVPPATPNAPVVVSKSKEIDLSWSSAAGAATYNVKRSTVSGGPYTTIANVTATSYIDLNVSNGTPYYYVISSVGQTKEGLNSAESFGVPGSTSLTWSTNPATDSLKLSRNWVENASPSTPAILTFQTSADTVLINDIQNLGVARFQFNAGANNYTISGDTLHLRNDLVNNAGNVQTFTTPAVLDTLLNVNTPAQSDNVTINSVISGKGTLMKNGAGYLFLSGKNTYSGGTIINGSGTNWPPTCSVVISGAGTGTPSAPASGPLGTGMITMNGGDIYSSGSDATLYNDITVAAGKTSYINQTTNAIYLYGRLLGSGTIIQDGNTYAGLHLIGDNSNFTGTFISKLRSGNNRVRFESPQAGSAKANWLLDANGNDCQGIMFGTGTLNFGSLSGRGAIRTDGGGSPIISIGALNSNTNYGGTMTGSMNVVKVGTGTLMFSGNQAYYGTTTIQGGTFMVNNDPNTGTFGSPVTVTGGAFGGTGQTTSITTIGTGSGAGAALAPGNSGIGTIKVGSLVMNSDGTYIAEMSTSKATADQVSTGSVSLVNQPSLKISAIDSLSLDSGASFTIINNTGSNPVSGTFKGLPELSTIQVGNFTLRITYKGGTGNDVVLMDDRTTPVIITSALVDTTVVGRSMTYTITGIKSPNKFSASGLPPGLTVDSLSGKISGTPTQSGNFNVTLTAANSTTSATATLKLLVDSRTVNGLLAASGDATDILQWNTIPGFTYNVKRATNSGGPYTTIGTASTANFTDASVVNGSTYFYVVAGVDSAGESPASAEVVAKPNVGQRDFYQFDEASGTTGIDSWGANHALLASTATRGTGKYGQSLLLNGSATSYASLPQGIFSTLNNFTISAWVRMDAISTWMRVFDFGNSTTQYMFLTVQAGVTSGKSIIRYAAKNGSAAEQDLNYNYTFPLNTWTYLALTRSGNITTLYVNGALAASSTNITINPSNLGTTVQNYLGKSQFSGDPIFKGSIDNFKVYSRALSASEIANDMLGDQTISFAAIPTHLVGDPDFAPNASATSGLPVSFTSSDTTVATIVNGNIHIIGAGTSVITATQAGNNSFKAATPVNQTLTVMKQNQTITFNALPLKLVTDSDFSAGAQASSGLPVSYSSSDTTVATVVGSNLHIVGAGTAAITATQNGNATYNAATAVTQTLMVNKLSQSITFPSVAAARPGDADIQLTATSSSGLPVVYGSSDTSVVEIVNNKLHIVGSGSSTITASQAGNARYYSASASIMFNVLPYHIVVQYLDGDKGQTTTNAIRPYLQIVNQDSVAVHYNELTARYWFTAENYPGTINTWIDYAQLGSGNISMKYVQLPNPATGALGYIEYSFTTSANLTGGTSSGSIQSRFANQDWSNFTQTDDYSYIPGASSYVVNNHITLYRNGVLIYGQEPKAVNATTALTVSYQNQNQKTDGNTISTYLLVNNTGNQTVNYSDLAVRYWFTSEGTAPLNMTVDYAKLGNGNVSGQFTRLSPALDSADTYLELHFAAGTLYPLSNSGNIQYQINKTDWSAFNEANDYSYLPKGPMALNDHITVYYKGQLIFGKEPPAAVGNLTAVNSNASLFQPNNKSVVPDNVQHNTIYPNPTNMGRFSIKLTSDLYQKNVSLTIRDLSGKVLQAGSYQANNGVIDVQLNAKYYPGTYLVQLNNLTPLRLMVNP